MIKTRSKFAIVILLLVTSGAITASALIGWDIASDIRTFRLAALGFPLTPRNPNPSPQKPLSMTPMIFLARKGHQNATLSAGLFKFIDVDGSELNLATPISCIPQNSVGNFEISGITFKFTQKIPGQNSITSDAKGSIVFAGGGPLGANLTIKSTGLFTFVKEKLPFELTIIADGGPMAMPAASPSPTGCP